MIQVFADTALAYDSRLESYELEGLTVTTGLNIGGTAEIAMPREHPAYNLFVSYRTIVTIYRDGVLRFRGRALYPSDGYYGSRTITCEGELCLFRDGVSRPYLYQKSPAEIFAAVVQEYNGQVEEFKQFKLGVVTVTDANDYIRLEGQSAESTLDTINKLLDRCGGYIVFTTDASGARVVNWLASAETDNNQAIEFGENLLSFASTGANSSPATGLIPYGAKKNDAGERLTVAEVNGGKDYILAEDAQAVRGTIMISHTWDDVYHADTLLQKARVYLAERKVVVTSLELTALDLSYLDKDLDSFTVGDMVQVISEPHGVNDAFQLTQLTEDLLDPSKSKITLGKEVRSLTGADVAGDNAGMKELEATKVQIVQGQEDLQQVAAELEKTLSTKIEQSEDSIRLEVSTTYARKDAVEAIEADLSTQIEQSEEAIRLEVSESYAKKDAVEVVEADLASLIQQTSDAILFEVSQEYATTELLAEAITTRMTQLKDQFLFEFDALKLEMDESDANAQAQLTEIYRYISFENGNIHLGGSDSPITLSLEGDLIVFKKNGQPFGWWNGVDFHTGNIVVEVNERAQFGDFAFVPRSNGSLSFLKIGG